MNDKLLTQLLINLVNDIRGDGKNLNWDELTAHQRSVISSYRGELMPHLKQPDGSHADKPLAGDTPEKARARYRKGGFGSVGSPSAKQALQRYLRVFTATKESA